MKMNSGTLDLDSLNECQKDLSLKKEFKVTTTVSPLVKRWNP
jgi:hypothetical protein